MANSEKIQNNSTKALAITVIIITTFVILAMISVKSSNMALSLSKLDQADASNWFGWNRPQNRFAMTVLKDATGSAVGTVRLQSVGTKRVHIQTSLFKKVASGFHGFHIHTVGKCEAPDFTSAGGHFNPTAATHSMHAGDMPSLLVDSSGSSEADFTTDRFDVSDLFDADGSAIILHSGTDNYANIPTRYSPPADTATQNTGDAGSRIACGVVQQFGRQNNQQNNQTNNQQ